jgi:IS5 family transposase
MHDSLAASEGAMRPKKHETTGSVDLFRARLDQIIYMRHELVQLAGKIDWEFIDGEIAPLYSDSGRPGISTQFVIGLFLLKHIYGLSDEGVGERGVHDPYFQHFTGEEFFRHEFPHEHSDLSDWRKRLGGKLEILLAESLRVAHESGAQRTKDLARVTVDPTVQPKDITFPTDAKLLQAAIKGLTRLATKRGVRLRQSYVRIAKRAAMMAGRYAHAKQFNRHHRQLRILRTRLGRLIRDIRRKIAGNAELEAVFAWPLSRADQIRSQQQRQRGWKLYSFHAGLRPHQTGAQTAFLHRGGDRTCEGRRPSRPLLSQRCAPAMPPMSSSAPSVTTSASFSPG